MIQFKRRNVNDNLKQYYLVAYWIKLDISLTFFHNKWFWKKNLLGLTPIFI